MATLRPLAPILRTILPWLAAALPALLLALLISENQVNTLFMDDWNCAAMLEKHDAGNFTARDYFAGYLEHRPAVMRALYIICMKSSDGDVRRILWVGFAVQLLTAFCVAVLARRAMGNTAAAWVMALVGLCFFSPLMWQGWLWSAMTIYFFPPFFLALGLVILGTATWPVAARWSLAYLCGILAVYSLGTGFPVLAILAGVAWWLDAMPQPGWKKKAGAAGLWAVLILAVVALYFHDLHNEVHPDHSYGLGQEQTVDRGIDAFLGEPLVAFKFALAVVGGAMVRGPLVDPRLWAAPVGGIVVAMVAGLAWFLWKSRGEPGRAALAGIYAIGLYGMASGLLVAMGRAWLVKGGSISPALNIRYVAVGSYTWAALIILFCIIMRKHLLRLPQWLPPFLLGVYLVWQCALWLYGVQMMGEWKSARLRGAAALHFLNVAVAPGHVLSEPSLTALREWSGILDRMGYLERPMLRSPELAQFKSGKPMSDKNAALSQVFRNALGEITVTGYGMHNSHQSPDAVLLARRRKDTEKWEAFHVVTYDVPPLGTAQAIMTDQTFINYDANLKSGRNPNFSRWSAVLARDEMPEGQWELSAWGYNYTKNEVYPIRGLYAWVKDGDELTLLRISEKQTPKL